MERCLLQTPLAQTLYRVIGIIEGVPPSFLVHWECSSTSDQINNLTLRRKMNRTNKLNAAEATLGHRFSNPDLLWEALQAAGSPNMFVGGKYLREGNKSLAGVGNAVMSLILKTQARNEDMTVGKCRAGKTRESCLCQARPLMSLFSLSRRLIHYPNQQPREQQQSRHSLRRH